jgi:hypothetical protein
MRLIFSSFYNSLYYKELDLPPRTFDLIRTGKARLAPIAICLIFLLAALPAFAQEPPDGPAQPAAAQAPEPAPAANFQKVYPIDTEIYQVIKSLYIAHGLALPSTTGPWTGAELLRMLGRLDSGSLEGAERSAYDYAMGEINKEHGYFKFNFTPTIEVHAHTNTEDFLTPDQYIRPINLTKPMLAFGTEAWLAGFFYAFGALDVGNKVYNNMVEGANGALYPGSTLFGAAAFSTNIWMVPPSQGPGDIDWVTPKRALVNVGGNSWSVIAGRDRLSWGPGQSGNFLVGSHIDYHDNIRASVWGDALKYTYSISSFQYPDEYYYKKSGEAASAWHPLNDDYWWDLQGINLFIAHRLEWRAWQNKLNFALSESVMYQNDAGVLNPMAFLPMTILHNIYRQWDMNSLLTFEADYTVIPGLNIYAQFALDEFAIPLVDEQASATVAKTPNAFGYMLGVQTAFPLGGRLFSASLEGAYTDPFLYLRGANGHNSQVKGEKGINFVVANRSTFSGDSMSLPLYYEEFLGYRWGGDAIVVNAHAGYREPGHWNVEANILFMVHGTFDKWTVWDDAYAPNDIGNNPQNAAPTSTGAGVENHADSNSASRDAPYYLTALSVSGSWNLPWVKGLSLYGQADFVFVVNPGNRSDNEPVWDLQTTFGVSYAF